MRIVRVLALAATLAAALAPAAAADTNPVQVQLLGLNDFHGHLEHDTPGRIAGVPAGGAEYLATHVRRLEAANENTLVVSAGDLIGGSPLLSALFHDEPTIEAMNLIGLDLNAVGNHEFDEGADELRRMQEGGCHPTDGCFGGDGFEGADFGFLAANVVDAATGTPIFAPYAIRKFDGVKVGFIGMTLEGTPDIVSQTMVQGLSFLDEADTANRYATELRREHGVRAIVVLLHEGGSQTSQFGINTCGSLSGPILDIVNRTTEAVDLFVTGHSHQPYNCVIDGRPVTSAASFGRLITDLDLTLDRETKDVIQVDRNNVVVAQKEGDVPVERAPDLTELVQRYQVLAAPLADRVIGRTSAAITRANDSSGEQAAGNLIADAQLAATGSAGAVGAFMNPGGVRADFPAGNVTYRQAFSVQPFANSLVTMTLTGQQVLDVLEEQWCNHTDRPRILLPSGVTYKWDPAVARIGVACPATSGSPFIHDLRIGGNPVDLAASYRITVNSFLADGGDRFFTLRAGTNRTGGAVDLDALENYLRPSIDGTPVAPPALDRISLTTG